MDINWEKNKAEKPTWEDRILFNIGKRDVADKDWMDSKLWKNKTIFELRISVETREYSNKENF